MGIWNTLQTLRQKALNVLWELVLPRQYINSNMNTPDASLWTEVSASNELRIRSERIMERWNLPVLDNSLRLQLTFGRKIAEGGQAIIYEARLGSSKFGPYPLVVKNFKAFPGVVIGLFPLELVKSFRDHRVCKPMAFFWADDLSLCMIMKRYSGDLREVIDSQMKLQHDDGSPFTELVAGSIIMQLAMGLRSLHSSGIYHRDLKCNNILVDGSPLDGYYEIVISDFETSEDVQGTGFWRAPEILQCLEENVSVSGIEWEAADIYSFGMTCYEILTGRSPFHNHRWTDYKVVLSGGRPKLPTGIPEGLRDIIQRCWLQDPKARPTFAEIVPLLEQIDEYSKRLDLLELSNMESLIHWESSLGTDEAILLELFRLVEIDRKVLGEDASKFVSTVAEFVSKFGWSSCVEASPPDCRQNIPGSPKKADNNQRVQGPIPLPNFAALVERKRLLVLMSEQYFEMGDVYDAHKKSLLDEDATSVYRESQISVLMDKVFHSATDGYLDSEYFHITDLGSGKLRMQAALAKSQNSEYFAHDDECLTLNDKFTIILKAFVEPLLAASISKKHIFGLAKQLLYLEFSKEDCQEEIDRFQVLFVMVMSPVYLAHFAPWVVKFDDIVLESPEVLFRIEHSLYFPFICILIRAVRFLERFIRPYAFVGQLAWDTFTLFFPTFIQLKILGWQGYAGYVSITLTLKENWLRMWKVRHHALENSTSVFHRILYMAVFYLLEMEWIHFLAVYILMKIFPPEPFKWGLPIITKK